MSDDLAIPEAIKRVTSQSLDAVLGQPIKVLDDGFVRVVDYLGGDESIVQAARVSYGHGTKKIHEDEGLIRYLMRHHHTTPFEMCEIKLHVRVPMDTWRQWIRHRTASVNEYSTRYSIAIDSASTTEPIGWRVQASGNRQGSDGYINCETGHNLSMRERELQQLAREVYEERIEAGVAREQARKDLPLSTYTEAYWKINLHNLLHFLQLRMDIHAQEEIRRYANVIGDIVKLWVPLTWQAFLDYRFNAVTLSDRELKIMRLMISGDYEAATKLGESFGWLRDGKPAKNRERDEYEAKAETFGVTCRW